MPMEGWEGTYISLTGKEPSKAGFMPTEVWLVDPDTPVGDMAMANRAYRARTERERDEAVASYVEGLVPYRDLLASPGLVAMPELLADPATSVLTGDKVRWKWNRENPAKSLVAVSPARTRTSVPDVDQTSPFRP